MLNLIGRMFLLLVLSASPRAASAETLGVSDPRFSIFPSRIRMCPAGDLNQSVNPRDVNNASLAGVTVELDFCACPLVKLCPAVPGDPYTIVDGCKVRAVSNASGFAFFPIRGGGLCSGPVQLSANGVVLGNLRYSVSPDQDGGGSVDGTDATIMQSKIGSADLTGDLDFNGFVDAADAALLAAHAGHACANVTPARESSWGRLKVSYR